MESISRGNMPIEAAAELGIKPATVYTQLTLINAKLGTRHWFGSYLRYAGGECLVGSRHSMSGRRLIASSLSGPRPRCNRSGRA
jgi:hypothetical protein